MALRTDRKEGALEHHPLEEPFYCLSKELQVTIYASARIEDEVGSGVTKTICNKVIDIIVTHYIIRSRKKSYLGNHNIARPSVPYVA